MLESFFSAYREPVVTDEIFEECGKLIFRDIAAIGFWKEGEIRYGAVGIEVQVEPKFYAFEIEIELGGIIFHIHHAIRPGFISSINVILVNGDKLGRMILGKLEITFFILSDQEDLRNSRNLHVRLSK